MTIMTFPIVSQLMGFPSFTNLLSLRKKMVGLEIKRDQCWLHWGFVFLVAPSFCRWRGRFWLDWSYLQDIE